jgi:hypothetical protein
MMIVLAVLHPRHKLRYFRDAGWKEDWIATAEKIVQDRFETQYGTVQLPDETQDVTGKEVRAG